MIDRFVELFRKQNLDRAKAREYLARQAISSFREHTAEYDAFVPYMAEVSEPAILIGAAEDSFGTRVQVNLPMDEVFCHWLVQGGTGTGKTTFVSSVFARSISLGYRMGIIDCKSGFFDAAINWAGALAHAMDDRERERFARSLTVVNPFGEALVPLNVCRVLPGASPEVQAYEVSLALSKLFDSSLSFQMENILRHLLLMLMESELSLAEAPAVLEDELLRGILAQRSRNPAVKDFFLRTYSAVPQGSKDALLARLQALLLPENLKLMLGADELLDFKGALDRGDPLIMFLGKGPGVPEEQVEVFGSLLLQLLFQAAYASRNGQREPYQIILDEFFHLLESPALTKRFETALTSLRSFRVTLTLVMHNFSQIPGGLRETILGNCDLMALFRTSARNAQYFGDFLPEIDPDIVAENLRKSGRPPGKFEVRARLLEKLQRLPNRNCYWYDRRKPYRAVSLRVTDLPEPHEAAGIPGRELEEFINTHNLRHGGAALSKETLRRQIEQRQNRLREIVRPPIRVQTSGSADANTKNNQNTARDRRPRLG